MRDEVSAFAQGFAVGIFNIPTIVVIAAAVFSIDETVEQAKTEPEKLIKLVTIGFVGELIGSTLRKG